MPDEHTFHPRDTLANTASLALHTTAAGAVLAGVQNALHKQNVGAMGILTRSGGTIALFAAVGASYQFTRDVTSNLRGKDDGYSEFLGGFVGGSFVGIARRSLPLTLGSGAVFGTVIAAYKYTGGFTGSEAEELDEDEFERREALRKMRRRPLSETIEQLGEGRGIYAPGWEERRRQRLLEKYGVDVKAAQESS